MTTTIMAETCSICAGSLKWTERTESQDPESTRRAIHLGRNHLGQRTIQERRRPIRFGQLVKEIPICIREYPSYKLNILMYGSSVRNLKFRKFFPHTP